MSAHICHIRSKTFGSCGGDIQQILAFALGSSKHFQRLRRALSKNFSAYGRRFQKILAPAAGAFKKFRHLRRALSKTFGTCGGRFQKKSAPAAGSSIPPARRRGGRLQHFLRQALPKLSIACGGHLSPTSFGFFGGHLRTESFRLPRWASALQPIAPDAGGGARRLRGGVSHASTLPCLCICCD